MIRIVKYSIVIFFILSVLYSLNYYLFTTLCGYIGYNNNYMILVMIIVFPVIFVFSRFCATKYSNIYVKILNVLAENLMGVLLVFLVVTFVFDVINRFILIKNTGTLIFATSFLLIIIGALNAKLIKVKKIRFKSKKIKSDKRVVLLSDIHIGSNKRYFLERIVEKVNSLKPDIVLITGDLVDERFVTYDDIKPIDDINSEIFFTYGNHEFYVGEDYIEKLFESTKMNVLRNEYEVSGDMQIIGIDDGFGKITLKEELQKIDLSRNKYKILMYHRPKGYKFASKQGIDLMVSGHTHGGQIIPFNFLVRLFFRKFKGLHKIEELRLYITTGTGVWGPKIRLCSRSEITVLELIKK